MKATINSGEWSMVGNNHPNLLVSLSSLWKPLWVLVRILSHSLTLLTVSSLRMPFTHPSPLLHPANHQTFRGICRAAPAPGNAGSCIPDPKVITRTNQAGGPSVGPGQRHLPLDPPKGPARNRNRVNEKAHSLVLFVLTKQHAVKIFIREAHLTQFCP